MRLAAKIAVALVVIFLVSGFLITELQHRLPAPTMSALVVPLMVAIALSTWLVVRRVVRSERRRALR
jgi:lipopolysaccharide export LptBFGC system permease protein LptF